MIADKNRPGALPGLLLHWRRLFLLLLLAATTAAGAPKIADAATIRKADNSNCRLELSGPIEKGDFEKFLIATQNHFPGFDGESTRHDVVCLNSPGGSLTEGVKFARHFYTNGVGTYIEHGAECYSACAIMFMMGLAEGPEVRFANRKMHVGGTLGFHRPYLEPELEGRVGLNAQEIAALDDLALRSALDLIELGNRKSPWSNAPMMMPDLIQQMLNHVGDDMFLVDNVDRAERFDIDIVGTPSFGRLTEEQAFYACENALQWQVGLTNADITYTPQIANLYGDHRRVSLIPTTDGRVAFEVIGLASGYAVEQCVIAETDYGIAGCGIDEYTGVAIGGGDCTAKDYSTKLARLDPMVRYNPATKLSSLLSVADRTLTSYQCVVLRGENVVDREPCSIKARALNNTDWPNAVHAEFTWPSGARTILRSNHNRAEINGVRTSLRPDSRYGSCFLNTQTGNEFCISKIE